ncbi:hypothetical protein PHET_05775 [Paragonimus heterotremus]|uniref:Uncharacterized protein n=1 Tax=Paragonimus heterotremus TaxID=100268 RepID=A0A8J4WG13_9TREM|nr:hypothetical protein PHET_05775 [Paragonimus heterotremus]
MCEVSTVGESCGSYSDLPPDWGKEELAPDEIWLLVVGILLDVIIALFFILIVAFQCAEEVQRLLRAKAGGKLPPYEKVADYLRSADNASTPKADSLVRKSVGDIEETSVHLEEKRSTSTLGPSEDFRKAVIDTERKHGSRTRSMSPMRAGDHSKSIGSIRSERSASSQRTSRLSSVPSSSLIHERPKPLRRKPGPSKPVKRRRVRYKSGVPSSVFLPISKAKPRERLLSSSDSGSSSPVGETIKLHKLRGSPVAGSSRTMPIWDPKDVKLWKH